MSFVLRPSHISRAIYAYAMRRNSSPPAAPTESFSGILDRLARRVEAREIELGEMPESKPLGAVKKKLTPVLQVRATRGKPPEETTLSYEAALRAHARYRPTPDPLHSLSPLSDPTLASTSPLIASQPVQPSSAEKNKTAMAVAAPARSRTATKPPAIVAAAVNSPTRSRNTAHPPTQPTPAKVSRTLASRTRTRTSLSPTSRTSAVRERNENRKSTVMPQSVPTGNKKLATTDRPLALRKAQSASLAVERKHASLSVRLSSQDMDVLRLRAAESGMTVSSYMRSCVLETEHLRAQVKQALSELRARTPTPDSIRLTAVNDTNIPHTTERVPWMRLFLRPAALFLGSWFSLRRGA